MALHRPYLALVAVALAIVVAGLLVWRRFEHDVDAARARAAQHSLLVQTRCGPIEDQAAGQGTPLLIVHGSGGGHDQGMAFVGALAQQGVRVIAMSRFGYLRTPLPADASPAAQADAHACLLGALGIARATVLGASAGTLSAMQLAIRHPDRVNALIVVVPIAYKPATAAEYTVGQIANAKFIGYERGGRLLVGHDDEVRRAIAAHLKEHAAR
jgi:pimeloyl-ACP methyl ester carboxylesterase